MKKNLKPKAITLYCKIKHNGIAYSASIDDPRIETVKRILTDALRSGEFRGLLPATCEFHFTDNPPIL